MCIARCEIGLEVEQMETLEFSTGLLKHMPSATGST